MDFSYFISAIMDNILVPVLVVIGSSLVFLVRSYLNKMTKSVIAKNDAEALEKLIEARSKVYQQVSDIVKTAVAGNMQLAEKMKEKGEKLTDEQINTLNEKAKNMISATLAPQMNDENSGMLDIIGGQDVLNQIIDGMIEKYVYEYKINGLEHRASKKEEDIKNKYANKKTQSLSSSAAKFLN